MGKNACVDFTWAMEYFADLPHFYSTWYKKAKQQGSWFDRSTSLLLVVGYAVPSFVFAILLIVFFAGGSYFHWFPLQNLVSDNFHQLSLFGKIMDYLWHMTLPLITMVLGGFASLTYLTKYSFLEELNKPYVLAAYAKGLNDQQVLYKHVFRNAILVVLAGLPEVLAGIFFVGNLFIEIIFHLDGVGLLGFEAIVQRDYPVILVCYFSSHFLVYFCDLFATCCINGLIRVFTLTHKEANNVSHGAITAAKV